MTVPRETEAAILRLHYGEHWPYGTIATQLGVHIDVVRRVLNRPPAGAAAPTARRPSVIQPYAEFIEQSLQQYPKLLATRLYDMIRERGYTGSVRTVREYVAAVRPDAKTDAFLRLETLPGEQAQIDWMHVGSLHVAGGERPLWAFVLVMSYSRAMWAELVVDLSAAALCRSLVRAAAYFGGVPRQWLFDNPKTVVIERHGDAVRFHPALLSLSAHLRVQPRLCGVAKPQEKGRVERTVRYLRDRFFAGRTVVDIDQGNKDLLRFFDEIAHQRPHPRLQGRTVAEVLAEEQPRLLALPDPLPPTEHVVPVAVDKTAFVRFDTNLYSVPPAHAGRTLTLVADDRVLYLLDGESVVARHARSLGRRQTVEDPQHRAELLAQRRAAQDLKGRDRLRAISPSIDVLLSRWVTEGRMTGPTVFRLVKMLDLYGNAVFADAVADLVAREVADLGAFAVACEKARRARSLPIPVGVAMPAHIPDRDVIPHDLEDYDEP